ncbi:MAG: dihydroorotate dehydrogenase electron transfer subunit, partial [Thermodesulfobacteriota bacterium]
KDDVVVVLGARNKEELEPLARDFGSLGYPLYLATDDGSLGHHGLVTDVLAGLDLTTGHEIHCCGPRPMMAAVHLFCRKIGVDCYVSMETAMACGMGACLGCNVPRAGGGYLHVCSDGPVFKSSELLWNL